MGATNFFGEFGVCFFFFSLLIITPRKLHFWECVLGFLFFSMCKWWFICGCLLDLKAFLVLYLLETLFRLTANIRFRRTYIACSKKAGNSCWLCSLQNHYSLAKKPTHNLHIWTLAGKITPIKLRRLHRCLDNSIECEFVVGKDCACNNSPHTKSLAWL